MRSCSIELFWVFLFFLFTFSPPSFSVPFLPENSVSLFGDAHFRNTSSSLTREFPCFSIYSSDPFSSGFGRAFYAHPICFLDSSTNTTASFSCQFSFTITSSSPYCPFGDGIAFLITSNAALLSLSNGYMGLPEISPNSDDSFFAVEFDTYFDPFLGDINGNHVSVDVNTILSVASADVVSKGVDLKSGREMTAWIEYNDLEEIIRVWIGYTEIRPFSPILVSGIDLSNHLKEFMHVGFTAFNGRGSAIHIVDPWQFKTFGFLSKTFQEEEDCLNCFPRDSRSEGEGSDYHYIDKRALELALGLGGLVIFVISVFRILGLVYACMVKRKRLIVRKCNEGQICRFQGNRMPKVDID